MSAVICCQYNLYCESVCLGILTRYPQPRTLFQLLWYLISIQLLFTFDLMLHFVFCAYSLKFLREWSLRKVCIFFVTVPISFLVCELVVFFCTYVPWVVLDHGSVPLLLNTKKCELPYSNLSYTCDVDGSHIEWLWWSCGWNCLW